MMKLDFRQLHQIEIQHNPIRTDKALKILTSRLFCCPMRANEILLNP